MGAMWQNLWERTTANKANKHCRRALWTPPCPGYFEALSGLGNRLASVTLYLSFPIYFCVPQAASTSDAVELSMLQWWGQIENSKQTTIHQQHQSGSSGSSCSSSIMLHLLSNLTQIILTNQVALYRNDGLKIVESCSNVQIERMCKNIQKYNQNR